METERKFIPSRNKNFNLLGKTVLKASSIALKKLCPPVLLSMVRRPGACRRLSYSLHFRHWGRVYGKSYLTGNIGAGPVV